jgi:hypothetical protein
MERKYLKQQISRLLQKRKDRLAANNNMYRASQENAEIFKFEFNFDFCHLVKKFLKNLQEIFLYMYTYQEICNRRKSYDTGLNFKGTIISKYAL